jgi:hypothetical protein
LGATRSIRLVDADPFQVAQGAALALDQLAVLILAQEPQLLSRLHDKRHEDLLKAQ